MSSIKEKKEKMMEKFLQSLDNENSSIVQKDGKNNFLKPPKSMITNQKSIKEIQNIADSDHTVRLWKNYIQQMTLHYLDLQYVGMAKIWLNLGDLDNGMGQWVYSKCSGALCIAKDLSMENQPPYIILFEMNNFNILYRMEIYTDYFLQLEDLNDYFIYSKIPFTNYYTGFSFPTESQCQTFKRFIKKLCPKSTQALNSNLYNNNNNNNARDQSTILQQKNQSQFFPSQNNNSNNVTNGSDNQSQIQQNKTPEIKLIQAESTILDNTKKTTESSSSNNISQNRKSTQKNSQKPSIQINTDNLEPPQKQSQGNLSDGEINDIQELKRINELKLTKEEKSIIRNAGIKKKELQNNDNIKRMVSEIFIQKKRQKRQEKKEQEELEQIKLRKTLNPASSFLMNTANKQGQGASNGGGGAGGFMSILKSFVNENNINNAGNLNQSQQQPIINLQNLNNNNKKTDAMSKIKGAFLTSLLKTNNLQDIARQSFLNQRQSQLAQSNMPINRTSNITNNNLLTVPQPPPSINLNSPMASPKAGMGGPPMAPNIGSLIVPSPRSSRNVANKSTSQIRPVNINHAHKGDQKSSLLEQIRNNNLKLRHVETNKQQPQQEFSKEEQIGLTAHLANEIKKRRNVIKKNYQDSDDSSDSSSWDEDSDYDI